MLFPIIINLIICLMRCVRYVSLSKMSLQADCDFEKDKIMEDIFQQLSECCEKAYREGVNSADIYKILHSPDLIFSKCNEDKINNGVVWSKKMENRYDSMKKVFMAAIGVSVLTVIAHLVFCGILNENPLKYFPSLQEKRCILPSHPLVMEMVRPVANCSLCTNQDQTGTPIIEFNYSPSKEEFLAIAYSSKPIIIRQGASLTGLPVSFDFATLKRIFESESEGVDTVSNECQFLPFRSPFLSLREAFDLISDSAKWDQPWYIGWSNCHPGVAAKLRKIFPRPPFLPKDSESSAIDWIFIGSPGLGASMHIDYVRRPSWQAQFSGVKRWVLRPPPECESICSESVTFTIYPGDFVFVDTNSWYHETSIEGDVLSISIGSEYD